MRPLSVFVGGSVGSDPYSPNTWSGCSRGLLYGMKQHGILNRACGLKVSPLENAAVLLKNFSFHRDIWRKQCYFDPQYRAALTSAAKRFPIGEAGGLQIGAMFSLPDVFPGKDCYSYHDGNLLQSISSGFGLEGVSSKRIDQALRYERTLAKKMTGIFTFSEYLRQSFIRDYGVSPNRVHAIGAGINFAEVPPIFPGKDYTGKKILFVGVDFARKGGPQVLRAFDILRQAHPTAVLHIVGPDKVDDLPAGVVFHGRLSKTDVGQKQELEDLFRSCTLFVMPSLYEPFGIAPLEAMCYQIPCILTNDWAFPEYTVQGVNGALVEKGSVENLAEEMKRFLADPVALARMGIRAREMVVERYTWSAVASRLAQLV